jgi:hypothetical protein
MLMAAVTVQITWPRSYLTSRTTSLISPLDRRAVPISCRARRCMRSSMRVGEVGALFIRDNVQVPAHVEKEAGHTALSPLGTYQPRPTGFVRIIFLRTLVFCEVVTQGGLTAFGLFFFGYAETHWQYTSWQEKRAVMLLLKAGPFTTVRQHGRICGFLMAAGTLWLMSRAPAPAPTNGGSDTETTRAEVCLVVYQLSIRGSLQLTT